MRALLVVALVLIEVAAMGCNDCGPSVCGACPPGSRAADRCVGGDWVCDCDPDPRFADTGPRDAGSVDAGASDAGAGDAGSPSDAGMMSSCADFEDRANSFVDVNQSCSVAADCTTVAAACYSAQQDCCVIYLRSDYDMAAWTEIHDGLMACAGGACGCCAALPAAPACIMGRCGPASAK